MSKRKATLGIAVLFALALSAFASSASAANLTAFTCVKDPPFGNRAGAHCSAGPGEYKHVEIKENETTTGSVTNANTAEETKAHRVTHLTGTLAGVISEISCTEVHGEGMTFENRKNAGGEMYFHFEGKLKYTKCVVTKPVEKGCKVSGEAITTNQVTGTTEGVVQPEQHTGLIKPKEGTTLASIKIEGCSVGSLNNTFPLSGSFKPNLGAGATVTSTGEGITAQNTLKFGGNKAGLDGALTFQGHSKGGEETKPLSFTTTP